jgi:hypothetical protein
MGCKIPSHQFFKFAPAGENVREVEFTSAEYELSRGVAVLAETLDENEHSDAENFQVGRQVGRVVMKDTALITGDLNIHGSGMFPGCTEVEVTE